MNENINLCEILKGHEDETFYCSLIGKDVQLYKIVNKIIVIKNIDELISFRSNGEYREDGEMQLFPSKGQRDWWKWIEEQKPKTPKTWNDVVSQEKLKTNTVKISTENVKGYSGNSPIEKSALALLKIHQIIKAGYGGNVTDDYFENNKTYGIVYYNDNFEVYEEADIYEHSPHISFHTREHAEEFISYEENIQLLRDYFMV